MSSLAYKLLIITFFVLSMTPKLSAQLIPLESDIVDKDAKVSLNPYYTTYKEVPAEPMLSENWYSLPEDISSRIEINNIEHRTEYFEDDDTPYLTKIIDGKKGRLFLKETIGYRYIVYDLQFVAYFDAEKDSDTQSNKVSLEIQNTNQRRDSERNTDTSSQNIDQDETLNNSVIPSFKQRNKGYTIFLDLILHKNGEQSRRDMLYRYDGNANKIYTEQYIYTDKGGVQRLIRTFEDGRIQRYVYFFNTGGLKEVYYEDPDGTSYVLGYTTGGSLSSKKIYDNKSVLEYEVTYTYDKKNNLVGKIEVDYLTFTKTQYEYSKSNLARVFTYDFKELLNSSLSLDLNREGDGEARIDAVISYVKSRAERYHAEQPNTKYKKEVQTQPEEAEGVEMIDSATSQGDTQAPSSNPQAPSTDTLESTDNVTISQDSNPSPVENREVPIELTEAVKTASNADDVDVVKLEGAISESVEVILPSDEEMRDLSSTSVLVKTERFAYNDTGEQILENFQDLNSEYVERVEFGPEGKITSQLKNGNLISRQIEKDNTKEIIYYFHSEPILKKYYENNLKIREEVFENGKVVEVREE